MTKKGFFGFFKTMEQKHADEEDQRQRDFAISQELEEQSLTDKPKPKKEKNAQKEIHQDDEGENIPDEILEFAKTKLSEIMHQAGFDCTIIAEQKRPGFVHLEITDTEETGRIIGREGSTIESLQILIKAMLFKKFSAPYKLLIDAGDYNKKRIENAKSQALHAARKINENHTREVLPPMGAAQRRAIHMLFKNDKLVSSNSIGQGPDRHIVLEKRENADSL